MPQDIPRLGKRIGIARRWDSTGRQLRQIIELRGSLAPPNMAHTLLAPRFWLLAPKLITAH